jgi:prephenate dehydrogenase
LKILIIDGQGGGLGRQLVSAVRERYPEIEILAVGTNSAATNAMLRAGADQAATGENSVAVASERADVIMGPVGIVIADSMLGEITPRMALSVGQSRAKRILIPVNLCDNIVVGVTEISMTKNVQNAVEALGALME